MTVDTFIFTRLRRLVASGIQERYPASHQGRILIPIAHVATVFGVNVIDEKLISRQVRVLTHPDERGVDLLPLVPDQFSDRRPFESVRGFAPIQIGIGKWLSQEDRHVLSGTRVKYDIAWHKRIVNLIMFN